jgi:serine/threonine-protein phosphatase 6 regulatory ankyrin repeat subunit B
VNDDDQEISLERVLQQAIDDNNDNLISFLMDINVTISGSEPLPQLGQSSSSSQALIESTFTLLKKQAELLLMHAASTGDNDTVKSLLDQNTVDVNYYAEDGETPLMMAAENNHVDVIKTLLLAGASKLVNHQTNRGRTALMAASQNGHIEVVKCLITEGVNINVQTSNGWTALMAASQNGHIEVVKCLITEGVNINVQTSNGWTALMAASQNGHLEVVKCLLTEGVDINVQTSDGA